MIIFVGILIFWYSDRKIFVQMMTFLKKSPDRKTEEEILTLRQVLTAKERHAAGMIDNWPHTNLKILHQNDKHVISDVKRFAKLRISRSEAPTGHHPVEGIQRGHDPGPEEPAGERHIQENSGKSSICKGSFPKILGKHYFQAFDFKILVDCTNLQDIAREKSAGLIAGISASSTFQVLPLTFAVSRINTLTNARMNFI